MQKIKSLINKIRDNFTEVWLGSLLFLVLPLAIGLYTDYRGFFLATVLAQSVVLTLFIYKGNR